MSECRERNDDPQGAIREFAQQVLMGLAAGSELPDDADSATVISMASWEGWVAEKLHGSEPYLEEEIEEADYEYGDGEHLLFSPLGVDERATRRLLELSAGFRQGRIAEGWDSFAAAAEMLALLRFSGMEVAEQRQFTEMLAGALGVHPAQEGQGGWRELHAALNTYSSDRFHFSYTFSEDLPPSAAQSIQRLVRASYAWGWRWVDPGTDDAAAELDAYFSKGLGRIVD